MPGHAQAESVTKRFKSGRAPVERRPKVARDRLGKALVGASRDFGRGWDTERRPAAFAVALVGICALGRRFS